MKKIRFVFAIVMAVIFCGCESDEISSGTAEQTVYSTSTEAQIHEDVIDIVEFDDYDSLMAEYTKGRSDNYVHPLPDIVNDWELESATLCGSNYTLRYRDSVNQVNIMLEIDYTSSYNRISDYFDGWDYTGSQSELIEVTERSAVLHMFEFDDYAMAGITGDENVMYTLVVNSDDETKDPVELLKEYKDLLEL